MRRRTRIEYLLTAFLAVYMVSLLAPYASNADVGSIIGRVTAEDGRSLARATVFISAVGGKGGFRTLTTDDDGRFQAVDLAPSSYSIEVSAPGYINSYYIDNEDAHYYRPGDTADVTMLKGGVITGKVIDHEGDPVVGTRVRAVRTKKPDGKLIRSTRGDIESFTDDRGVYRIFGLYPGSYLVVAGGSPQFELTPSPHGEDVPIYYPSSTRRSAKEVTVRAGEEATGIDISFRTLPGHSINGTITGDFKSGAPYGISLMLFNASTKEIESTSSIQSTENPYPFSIQGVPDGEYELTARAYGNQEAIYSMPRRITVKGADIDGVSITLLQSASIEGRVLFVPDPKSDCKSRQLPFLEETIVTARLDEKETPLEDFDNRKHIGAPDSKGEISFRNMDAGRYRFETKLSCEDWYIKSIEYPDSTPDKRKQAGAKSLIDASDGFALKSGERVKDLSVTITEGAAAVNGKIVSSIEGKRLPEKMRVHLVPADAEHVNNALRYFEAASEGESFSIKNIPPGKYWVLAKSADDKEADKDDRRPIAWNSEARLKLRREAEAAKQSIELAPCSRTSNFALRFGAAKSTVKK